MRPSLDDELTAIERCCRPGTQRLRAYARLVGDLERHRDQASLREVRGQFTAALHRVYAKAKQERERR